MIEKFQEGGQPQGGILAQIQQLPKEQLELIMQAFAQWAQQKGIDVKQLQSDPQILELALGQFMLELQSQKTQSARHGAKLNYLKTLKHQCAEDEEVVYYRNGGSVDCGCRKKEDGGEIKKAQEGTVVDKFKNRSTNVKENKCGGKVKKDCGGSKLKKACNGAVAKFKNRKK